MYRVMIVEDDDIIAGTVKNIWNNGSIRFI